MSDKDSAALPKLNPEWALRRGGNNPIDLVSDQFWHEFKLLRTRQRRQLVKEHQERKHISQLVRQIDLEAQEHAKAMVNSLSGHSLELQTELPQLTDDANSAGSSKSQVTEENAKSPSAQSQQLITSNLSLIPQAPPSSLMDIQPKLPLDSKNQEHSVSMSDTKMNLKQKRFK